MYDIFKFLKNVNTEQYCKHKRMLDMHFINVVKFVHLQIINGKWYFQRLISSKE